MGYLSFIEDEVLESFVYTLLNKGHEATQITEKQFHKNTIDPFSVLFEMASFERNLETWKHYEENRQAQKTLSNHLGDFHQNFLGVLKDWENLKTGKIIDLKNDSRKICAEVKNKHNTLNAGALTKLYENLEKEVMSKNSIYNGYTAYYVAIIPKSFERYNIAFTPSDIATGNKKAANEKIREIDGASFYALATGEENALEQLFNALPQVICRLKPNLELSELEKSSSYFRRAFLG